MQLVRSPLQRSQIVAQSPGNSFFQGQLEGSLAFCQGNTRMGDYGNGGKECQLAIRRKVPAKHATRF
jgi:hypothetical protein